MTTRAAAVSALIVIALAAPARADQRAAALALADSFVRGLASENFAGIHAFANDIDRRSFVPLVNDLEYYGCVTVRGYRVVEQTPMTVQLDIDATGISNGAAHRESALPSSWVLEVDCAGERCRLRRAETAEARAARLLVQAPPDDLRAAELCPELDRERFVRQLLEQFDKYYDDSPLKRDPKRLYAYALRLARGPGDGRALESSVWYSASWDACRHGQHAVGLELARACVAAAEESGDPDRVAAAHFRLGIVQWIIGSARGDALLIDAACRSLERGGASVDALDDPRIGIKSLFMAAYVHRTRSRLRDFLLIGDRVHQLSRRYRYGRLAASQELAFGDLDESNRDWRLAIAHYRAAYDEAMRAFDHEQAALALTGLALVHSRGGDAAQAAEMLRKADEFAATAHFETGSSIPEISLVLGHLLEQAGRLQEAEQRYVTAWSKAHEVAPWRIAINATTLLAGFRLRQKHPVDALALAEEALEIYARDPIPDLESYTSDALFVKAKALRTLGRNDESLAALRAAVDAIDDLRTTLVADPFSAAHFLDDKSEIYVAVIAALIERGRAAEAFDYAERMKARELIDMLARGDVDRESMLTAQEKEEERRLAQRLAVANKEALLHPRDRGASAGVAAARLALEQFDARTEIAHPMARVAHPQRGGASLPGALGGGALVEFVVGERQTIVFAVARGKLTARVIRVSKGELADRVERLSRRIAQRDLRWTESASDLYALLLAPVESSLRGKPLLCVVPDDVLWRVPFHLLRRGGRGLIERAAVFYAPSLSMLRMQPQRAAPAGPQEELLAFGNPAVRQGTDERVRALARDVTLGNLPEAESEVRRIASLYDERKSRVYVRDAAREAVFKREAPRFRVVHFAAHGILDDRSPMYSAIVLAAGPNEADDGLLEAREILELHIPADLAVLAACDTARGGVGAGEGMIGMSWAFLVAGCSTTVVSQWDADSRATEPLMVEFHRRLRAGDSPARALQRAQLAVSANPRYHDPRYWAPFIVVGSGYAATPPERSVLIEGHGHRTGN
ncbi:MAG TPA: CHAT domain-containing protein [Thermoanaerobaculia bacterium]|jgi:CHAT domain-containing protein